jgi:hypothetical protein
VDTTEECIVTDRFDNSDRMWKGENVEGNRDGDRGAGDPTDPWDDVIVLGYSGYAGYAGRA